MWRAVVAIRCWSFITVAYLFASLHSFFFSYISSTILKTTMQILKGKVLNQTITVPFKSALGISWHTWYG